MKTRTYFEHIDLNGKETGPRAKFLGTEKYGYKTVKLAQKYCPKGSVIQERHDDGFNDWAGRIVWVERDLG